MLTIFTVPKPFEGHIGMIQRNAIVSWASLQPRCQIILCGNEAGSRDVAAELGLDQIEVIDRNEFGTPLLSSVFQLAEERAAFDRLCYANADLILLPDFMDAARRVSEASERFLMVGQTWDLEVTEALGPRGTWEDDMSRRAEQIGTVRPPQCIDYFLYPRHLLGHIPAFAVGRPAWDNWMIYRARSLQIPVVNVSSAARVIHQHHGYGHVSQARGDKWQGPEGDHNLALLGFPKRNSFSLSDATHQLTDTELVPVPAGDFASRVRTKVLLSAAIVPVYRTLRPIYRALRRLRRVVGRG